MPFRKVGADDYVSPSGRHWTSAQVRLYHATKGFKKTPTRAREVNHCHGPGRGHPCGGGGGQQSRTTWLTIDAKTGRVGTGGPGTLPRWKKKRPKHMKIDTTGRVTYEALTPEALLAEERERVLREFWSPAARAASAAARRGAAGIKRQVADRGKRAAGAVAAMAKNLAGITVQRDAARRAMLARDAAAAKKTTQKAPKAAKRYKARVNVGAATHPKGNPWAGRVASRQVGGV
jgi:hypothetical protein